MATNTAQISKPTNSYQPQPTDGELSPRWRRFVEQSGGVLVIGHGTRKPAGVQQLHDLAQQISDCLPGVPVEACFLELAYPTIGEGLVQLRDRGCDRFVSIPILLFAAGHAKEDIPDAVRPAAKSIGILQSAQAQPLELTPEVQDLSAERFDMAISGCDRQDLGRIGLAMVGRGSSYSSAIRKMHRLASLRAERSRADWHSLGFFAAAEPTVRQMLEQAAGAKCDTVVIQPHLLFEGLLMDELRELHAEFTTRYPGKRWLMAESLGADNALAKCYVRLAERGLAAHRQRGWGLI